MVLVLLGAILLAGCARRGATQVENVSLKVFAASSTTNAMQDMEETFEADHPDVDIQLNLAGSKTLRSQIENGADADIFISANSNHYNLLKQGNMIKEGRVLVENELVLIVYKASEVEIEGLDDLTKACQIVMAQSGVPAGNYAREVIRKYMEASSPDYDHQVISNVVSQESNVRQVLMKVAMGEADAGFVYRTDVTENVKDSLKVIDIPELYNVTGRYYIGLLKGAQPGSKTLYDFILSQRGDEILESYGFMTVDE